MILRLYEIVLDSAPRHFLKKLRDPKTTPARRRVRAKAVRAKGAKRTQRTPSVF
jgi:hypothetical protein